MLPLPTPSAPGLGSEDRSKPALRVLTLDRPPGLTEYTVQSVLRFQRPNRDTVICQRRWAFGSLKGGPDASIHRNGLE